MFLKQSAPKWFVCVTPLKKCPIKCYLNYFTNIASKRSLIYRIVTRDDRYTFVRKITCNFFTKHVFFRRRLVILRAKGQEYKLYLLKFKSVFLISPSPPPFTALMHMKLCFDSPHCYTYHPFLR